MQVTMLHDSSSCHPQAVECLVHARARLLQNPHLDLSSPQGEPLAATSGFVLRRAPDSVANSAHDSHQLSSSDRCHCLPGYFCRNFPRTPRL